MRDIDLSTLPRTGRAPSKENRLGLDYRAAAAIFPKRTRIIDIHTHLHGEHATRLYDEARRCYGVDTTYTMTQITHASAVRDILGDSVRFIAMPTWSDPDRASAHGPGYLKTIERFHHEFGARMLKVWAAPRLRELVADESAGVRAIDSPMRIAACELGQSLGMMFMVHVADPDTWFSTKYKDARIYGSKREQYEGLERMVDRFPSPWIAAHMGGWPEDLDFLDALLTRHPNLHLDTSATKWVVRALSAHPSDRVRAFFVKWKERIMFGTDIVTMDDHVSSVKAMGSVKSDQAGSPEEAFDLYASRFFALRALLESRARGESPIADSDLMMVDSMKYNEMSAPELVGQGLPEDVLDAVYAGNALRVVGEWERQHP